MHHVDGVLDAAADSAVRDVWERLLVAGLPSLALHRSPSNRPHVTLAVTREWPSGDALVAATRPLEVLPVRLRPGPLVVFGTGPFVLALGVVPSQGLVALHRALATALRPARGHLEPGAWTPHVTLANRLSAGQVGAALEVLAAWDRPADLVVASARHWDSGQQLDEPLG